MTDMLARQDGNEYANAALEALVPPRYADWLQMETSPYEALLVAPPKPEVVPKAPGPDVHTSTTHASVAPLDLDAIILGSNNFAVAGSLTADGRAILANDPHLMISAPAIWYRCKLEWPDHMILGLSLPGVPGVVIGTNGHVAFGMTNTTGDFRDNIIIEVNPKDQMQYRTPEGWENFSVQNVTIGVRGSENVVVESRWTRWGPVTSIDKHGRPMAVLSVPWQPGGVNVELYRMVEAKNVDEAVEVIRRWNGPSQNVLIADSGGRIAWIVSGWIPNRVGYDGRVPVSLADGAKGWFGQLPEEERPVVVDPPEGFLFTANSRTLPLVPSSRIGCDFANPCRSFRIRADLQALKEADEAALLAIQLDDYAQMLVPYRPLYLEGLHSLQVSDERDEAIALEEAWDGRATLDTLALEPVDQFRTYVIRAVRDALLSGTNGESKRLASRAVRENAVLAALDQRPPHLHPDGAAGWSALLATAAKATLHRATSPWGETNRSTFKHPLAMASDALGSGFDLPSAPQAGYRGSPRVAAPTFGASARIIVSPNHLEDALLQTPGGQSGDPFSAHYHDFHETWATGSPEPLEPGATKEVIQLKPS
jgi:penicillin amidase